MKVTAPTLIRWSGLAAIAAGLIFAGIQPIHPPDVVASVTTNLWTVIIGLKFLMCLFFLVGVTGIYARQADKAGWLGFAGFALLIVSWWLQTGFVFVELFVLPVVAPALPGFVESALGVANGQPGAMDIGAFVPAYGVLGVCYLLGGVLFGIATVRAAVLPRWPAILLARCRDHHPRRRAPAARAPALRRGADGHGPDLARLLAVDRSVAARPRQLEGGIGPRG